MDLRGVSNSLLLVGGLVLSLALQSAGPKPIQTSLVFVNYAAPPTTLEGLTRISSAVIVGDVAGANTQSEWENRGQAVFTDYHIRIGEVLKPHDQLPVVGTVVTVRRSGGDWDAGNHIVRGIEPGFPQFSIGDTYLLFLHWNDARSTFEVRAGPNGAYRLSNGVLDSNGQSALAAKQKGRSVASVLAELRMVVQN
jgi:hypothetical protein